MAGGARRSAGKDWHRTGVRGAGQRGSALHQSPTLGRKGYAAYRRLRKSGMSHEEACAEANLMTILIAIDPGNVSGFAVFTDGRLTAAWSASPDAEDGQVVGDIAVIECPTRAFAGISPKSIFTLSRTAGRYIERYRRLQQHLVEPRDWKGTVDGDIMTARIRAALTPSEQAICSLCNYDHNMLDAVGLGKWALRQPWMRVLTKQADR